MRIWVLIVTLLAIGVPASAQQTHAAFEVGVHFASARSSQFDASDFGAGGRVAWNATNLLGVEAEMTVFPGSFPDARGFSARRFEGLFGATAGPRIGRVRPFGRVRPGFVRYSAADEPIVCIAIFPPPLSCVLAAGRTMLALDLGGGVDLSITRSAFVRVDVGDRLVRFPGTVIDPDFIRHDRSFFSHEFRFAAGGGVRF